MHHEALVLILLADCRVFREPEKEWKSKGPTKRLEAAYGQVS